MDLILRVRNIRVCKSPKAKSTSYMLDLKFFSPGRGEVVLESGIKYRCKAGASLIKMAERERRGKKKIYNTKAISLSASLFCSLHRD